MNDLHVTLVQTRLFWNDVSANLLMLSEKLKQVGDTDIIILPETFSTGFSMDPEFCEEENGAGLQWMKEQAAEKNCVLTGSLMVHHGGKNFNRLYWVQPDGVVHTYDKRHLFSLSDEQKFFTAGNRLLTVKLKGWNIRPLICYDLRFPVWSRNVGSEYDVLFYVANWPERRAYAWKQLLVARAIENQSYVIGVNRVGEDGNKVAHAGDSMVVDSLGVMCYHCAGKEEIHTVALSYADLQETRKRFPFLKDADKMPAADTTP